MGIWMDLNGKFHPLQFVALVFTKDKVAVLGFDGKFQWMELSWESGRELRLGKTEIHALLRFKDIAIAMAVLKKGTLVKAIREQLDNSTEAIASDSRFPAYLFDTPGEIMDLKGDYALVKFRVPTPNVWLRQDQLEAL
jgi:hypothetical protein